MLALFFALIALYDWFLIKSKSSKEKWGFLILILLVTVWNVNSNLILWWLDPFTLINMALGWIN